MSMLSIFKPIGAEVVLNSTPTTVDNAKLVRIANDTTSPVLVTVKSDTGIVYASFTMLAGTEKLLQKSPVYTIESATALKVCKASF